MSPSEKSSPSEHGSSSSSISGPFIEDSFPWVPSILHPPAHSHTQAPPHTMAYFKDSCQNRTSIGYSNKKTPNLNGFAQQNCVSCSVPCGFGWSSRSLTIQGPLVAGLHTQRITHGLVRDSAQVNTHVPTFVSLSRNSHKLTAMDLQLLTAD